MATKRASARPKKYKPDAVRKGFAPWFRGRETEDGEQPMFCPLCEDPSTSTSASASMNPDAGVWNCLKGEHGGSVFDLVQTLKRERGFSLRGHPSGSAASSRKASAPVPLPDQDKPYNWHDQMMLSQPDRLAYLTEQRGLTEATVARFKIGWDGERYTIPVRIGLGKWINARRYLPGASAKNKMLNVPGHGTAVLAFTEVLQGNSLPVLLCEGEWDALLAGQHGEGLYVAVTGTGGADSPPRDLSLLAGREVFVAYDADLAGERGAEKVAKALRAVGARVHIINPRGLGLPFTDTHGADISDWLRQYGGTAEKLLAEMERLREADANADSQDDVLTAIEALFLANDEARLTLIADVRTDDQILDMPPARYVIDGWLPVGFFSSFFGEPGARKTFVILDMLHHIRAGVPWHGHDVTRGATLLFEGEGLEQLQSRIIAWNEFHDHPDLAPGGAVSTPVDMTTPQGVASVARTVRDFERRYRVPVVAAAFDPLVEYMNGEENGEGMELVTRGLRALARYLDIAVIVGAHTNASGERARGGDHLRMRSGAHVRVETLKGDLVGLVQEKQKNGERRALQLMPNSFGSSLVLSKVASMSAAQYAADKFNGEANERAQSKIRLSETASARKSEKGDALLLDCVREHPGVVRGSLLNACTGQGVGKPALEVQLNALIDSGTIRVERTGTAKNAATRHYIADESGGDP
ncbi:AAA family ATPase [Microbacterium paludicola]|uniref:AAA family ATPase n=1 Tax=Microbacterium paludicola TaxID=300019 RepID=UPI0031E342F9